MSNFFKSLVAKNKNLTTEQVVVKKTVISFFFFFLLAGAAYWGWQWLQNQPSDGAFGGGIKQPLRTVLDKNEKVFNDWLSDNHLTKTYPLSAAVKRVRVNGDLGMGKDFDPSTWSLYVIKTSGDTLTLKMDDIKKAAKDRNSL